MSKNLPKPAAASPPLICLWPERLLFIGPLGKVASHRHAAVVLVAVGLIVQMLLLETLGWIPASTILFMVVARAFGSRKIVKDAILGLALTAASFGLFNYGLDLNLPVGSVFEELMAEPDDAAG